MGTYYRLASIPNTLPLHWCYSSAWEFICDKNGHRWEDNRAEGFQGFSEANQVIRAASGEDMDGDYSFNDYPQILIIEADQNCVYDGCSMYFAIAVDGVETVRGVDSQKAVNAITSLYESQKEQYDYDSFAEWCEDSEEEIVKILRSLSTPVEVKFIETLPCPQEAAIAV